VNQKGQVEKPTGRNQCTFAKWMIVSANGNGVDVSMLEIANGVFR